VCIFISGTIFVKSKHIKRFCEGFHTFCPTFHRFSPDFHQIKTFGRALAPSTPPSPTPLAKPAVRRAGLNEHEAPGKVVTSRPPKRLAQLRSVSHALVSTLQKHQSKTSTLIRFGSLHFRDNWG